MSTFLNLTQLLLKLHFWIKDITITILKDYIEKFLRRLKKTNEVTLLQLEECHQDTQCPGYKSHVRENFWKLVGENCHPRVEWGDWSPLDCSLIISISSGDTAAPREGFCYARAILDKQSCVITSTLFEMNTTCMCSCDLNFSCLSTSITLLEVSGCQNNKRLQFQYGRSCLHFVSSNFNFVNLWQLLAFPCTNQLKSVNLVCII